MRKLDGKNKFFITGLLIFVIIIFVAAGIFIAFRIKSLNVKYEVNNGSVVLNTNNELVKIIKNTYAKKDILGRYYIEVEKEKIYVGDAPVIFNVKNNDIKLLGTFYEILENGKIDKLKGETTMNSAIVNRIFKIADRRYLIVGNNIKSKDDVLDAKSYLLVNIDKAGNAYLYNKDINIKTFKDLEIVTDAFTFKVNEEKLIIDEEEIDLAKINGSTNEYDSIKKPVESTQGGGSSGGETVYNPQPQINTITQTITENKYITRKTSILNTTTTTSSIEINYVVYDPFIEYTSIYVNLYLGEEMLLTATLDANATNHVIKGLTANTDYRLDFYYSYLDEAGNTQNVLFDTMVATTKNINASISLAKVSGNSVRYILKIEDGYVLDSAKVVMYIDGVVAGENTVNTTSAASTTGYEGTIEYTGIGEFVRLELKDCIYNGASIDTKASYKYKM